MKRNGALDVVNFEILKAMKNALANLGKDTI